MIMTNILYYRLFYSQHSRSKYDIPFSYSETNISLNSKTGTWAI